MSFGGLAFLNPALLAGLVALPLIWWLLRAVPPAPKRVAFPATRILVGLENREKQTDRTPWWLTLIRLLAAAALIFALAEPVLNPERKVQLAGSGPIAIIVDNGWTSSARWGDRRAELDRRITEAEAAGRSVVIVPTASITNPQAPRIEAPAQARSTAAALEPQPFAPDRARAAELAATALTSASGASVVWLTDGIDHDGGAYKFAEQLIALARGGTAVAVEGGAGTEALGIVAGLGQGGRLEASILRASGPETRGRIIAVNTRGQRLGETPFTLGSGLAKADIKFDLPLELRNQVTRLEIAGERSAGAVNLLDARSQFHRIGVLSGASREQSQPLLAPLYYIERALQPFAEIARTDDANPATAIDTLIKRNISVLLLADIGTLPTEIKAKVAAWVRKGGVLVRFAGPRLENGGDELIPSPLRVGGRALGGALSWSTPQPMAPLTDDSLFAGLAVPPDVMVNRQVLADPARLGAETKIWARLKDGTPLVTGAQRGEGQVVLFHVTANSEWSNLPISGLFVEMLRRIATLGRAGGVGDVAADEAAITAQDKIAAETAEVLAPSQVLDGYGVLKPPPPTAQAIPLAKLAETKPSAQHPPGYYGAAASPRALNLITAKTELKPLPSLPSGIERRAIEGSTARPLKPHLLTLGLMLLFVDIIAILLLSGLLGSFGRTARTGGAATLAAIALLASAFAPGPARAQIQDRPQFQIPRQTPPGQYQNPSPNPFQNRLPPAARPINPPPTGPDARSIISSGKVTFGYVRTGDASVDRVSEQGLKGLNLFLIAKTAVEPGDPQAVDIATDEIAFYPMLYWPVLATSRPLNDVTLGKIDAYMKNGGMIIFDTRDAGTAMPPGFGLDAQKGTPLQRLLGTLDLPRLEPVPETHVLTKSFYLLRQFPGRFDNGQLWVEAEAPADSSRGRQARRVDGVSSVLVTSNDFASAWALDERFQPLFPVVPGGERQREQAFRVGVNIVMYALTGNYKADQVHVPALLERLGN